jgi:hypothetical protein
MYNAFRKNGLNRQVSNIAEVCIRNKILKTFYKGELKHDISFQVLISCINTECFGIIFTLLQKYPSIISIFKYINHSTFEHYVNVRKQKKDTNNDIYNSLFLFINHAIDIGGTPLKAFDYGISQWSKYYLALLSCGVKEKDIEEHIYTPIEPNKLLEFKTLIPIVGYYYAKDFILERKCNIDEYPYFLQVASKMNEQNIYNDKYLIFSKIGGSVDRVLTLRNRKRKADE